LARVRFIEYKNQQILELDLSYCNPEEVLAVIREGADVIRSRPERSLLTLTKTEGASFDSSVIKAMKEFTKGNEPYVRAAAIVGVKGLQKVVLDAVSLFSKREFGVYGKEDQAKEYLIKKVPGPGA
jgi:hypothetical protein